VDAPDNLTLDPEDWESFRRLAHAALDEALNYVQTVRQRPAWQPLSASARAALSEPLPIDGAPLETVYNQFLSAIFPYATGNLHPLFFGWVHGSGQPNNIVAELLASAMNSNCGGRDHGATYVEREVIGWCKQLFSFPAEAGGLLVSGSSMANLIALAVARNSMDISVRQRGITAELGRPALYASAGVHSSVAKALELIGLGTTALRPVAVNDDFTIDIAALRRMLAADRAAGLRPFCIVGTAGAVDTGAIDDLDALASLCADEKLWFHVDGAFGALCALSDALRPRLKGIERADSLAFDFHKWAHVQYDAACILVRDGKQQRAAFSARPDYLRHLSRGLGAGEDWPSDYGPELSRGFRALKIWFAFKEHGARTLGRLIDRNCAQARYLAARIEREPQLELLAPAALNIVCFRARFDGLEEAALDALNEEIVADVQESGIAAPSSTRIRGRFAVRASITNHRTRLEDLDIFVDAVLAAARARLGALKTPSPQGA
jgi:aromatic-L-amino-acid/L-tryptophan decarboxylase